MSVLKQMLGMGHGVQGTGQGRDQAQGKGATRLDPPSYNRASQAIRS